jgi:hypothetical protein
MDSILAGFSPPKFDKAGNWNIVNAVEARGVRLGVPRAEQEREEEERPK